MKGATVRAFAMHTTHFTQTNTRTHTPRRPQTVRKNCFSPRYMKQMCVLTCVLSPAAEIEPWIRRFRAEGTVDYSQLTFDPGQNELIVGAR